MRTMWATTGRHCTHRGARATSVPLAVTTTTQAGLGFVPVYSGKGLREGVGGKKTSLITLSLLETDLGGAYLAF